MFYALVMLITINGRTDEFVLDTRQTESACRDALYRTRSATLYSYQGVNARVTFRCERTRVMSR